MPNEPTDKLSKAEAQILMSQLMDGEIDPADAERLNAYLEVHPEEMDWMESASLTRDSLGAESSDREAEDMRQAVLDEIQPRFPQRAEPAANSEAKLIRFPLLFRSLAAAAALTLVATVTWFSFKDSNGTEPTRFAESSSIVKYVETDLPDASPVVYTDAESGWTIVWIEQIPQEAG